jgi:hypothetical protein
MSAPLLPIAPILLLPFLLVAAVVGLPLWIAALIVLGVLRLLVWPLERLVVALGSGEMSESRQLAAAFRWVLTFGGLTKRFSGARVGSASMMSGAAPSGRAGGDAAPRA